jgi:uncharacterized membrane protein YtjA (UPF0391 family)
VGNRIATKSVSDGRLSPRGGVIAEWRHLMLYWAAVFLLIAIIAGFLGFGGVASAASGIAQVLFFIFLVIFLVATVVGLGRRRGPTI